MVDLTSEEPNYNKQITHCFTGPFVHSHHRGDVFRPRFSASAGLGEPARADIQADNQISFKTPHRTVALGNTSRRRIGSGWPFRRLSSELAGFFVG